MDWAAAAGRAAFYEAMMNGDEHPAVAATDAPFLQTAAMLRRAMRVVLAVDTSPYGCPVCYAAHGDPHGGDCAVPRLSVEWEGES